MIRFLMALKRRLPKLPVWWHVANELLGLELLEFLIPTFNIQKRFNIV